jgi:hypothetical protein
MPQGREPIDRLLGSLPSATTINSWIQGTLLTSFSLSMCLLSGNALYEHSHASDSFGSLVCISVYQDSPSIMLLHTFSSPPLTKGLQLISSMLLFHTRKKGCVGSST